MSCEVRIDQGCLKWQMEAGVIAAAHVPEIHHDQWVNNLKVTSVIANHESRTREPLTSAEVPVKDG